MSNLINNKSILLQLSGLLAGVLVLVTPATSLAYFLDDATATDSTFTAGTVSFTVPAHISASLNASNPVTTSFTLTDTGNIDADYLISTTPVACSASFYNGLEARLENPAVIFDGMLNGVLATSTSAGDIDIILQASSTMIATQNETCTVELSVYAWQSGFPSTNFGFSDTKTIFLTITASEDIGIAPPLLPLSTSNIVLNEIYPSILATSTAPLEREWVELYNGTAGAIDVAGWTISEFVGGDINNDERYHKIVSDCTGYAVSTHSRPFGTNDTVILPGGYLVIEFCGTAEYLSNSGDTVRLYDTSGTSTPWIDTHTFGNTTNGKSHARIPDGGTWVDPIPTPGTHNVATKEDLKAEGWSEEQIVAVLGEEVYQTDAVTSPLPEEKQENSFGFASSTIDTALDMATSTNEELNEPTSSSTATTSTKVASTTPEVDTPTDPVTNDTPKLPSKEKDEVIEVPVEADTKQVNNNPTPTDEPGNDKKDEEPKLSDVQPALPPPAPALVTNDPV
jgi:hypothetical protein